MTDTQPPRLSGETPPDQSLWPAPDLESPLPQQQLLILASRRHRWWAIPTGSVGLMVLLAVAVSGLVSSGRVANKHNLRLDVEQAAPYARTPAAAKPVDDLITFGDLPKSVDRFEPTGDIYFVTVSEMEQSVLSWLVGRHDPAIQFMTNEEKFGFQPPEQRRVLSLESMHSAEQVAQFMALQRLGFDVDLVPGDVLIEEIVCLIPSPDGSECVTWSPSDDVLDPGDRILEMDGHTIDGVEDLGPILDGRLPGDIVKMTIERPEVGKLKVEVELTVSPDEPDRTIIGFYPFDTRRVVLPFELDINTGQIGGPSAGLAFTLALIDELTEGELTGGARVAVTGTIQLDGTVGAIGGLRQKASAVAQAGIAVFIVPAEQGEEDIAAARLAGGPGLRIIAVHTLEEAIEALVSIGGEQVAVP